MQHLRSPWLLAVTPVMLCSVTMYAPFISLRHRFIYHANGSVSEVLVALLLNLGLAYLVFVGILKLAERYSKLGIAFWSVFVLLMPWLLLRGEAVLMDRFVPHWVNRSVLFLGVAALVAEGLLWRTFVKSRFHRVYGAARTFTAVLSLGWLVTIGQLAYYALATRGNNGAPVLHEGSLAAPSAKPEGRARQGKPRVIWIVLDELGYDQTFGRRPPGLQLPAFDGLAAQSVVFTNAVAPGDFTEQVIPAVMMGEPAQQIAFTSQGHLLYENAPGKPWQRFQPWNTVFADALHAGYNTAVAGWHNPYCRLLAPVLDECFWSSRVDSTTSEFDSQASFEANLLGPARRLLTILRAGRHGNLMQEGDREYAAHHIEDVRTLIAETDRLIADPSADFLLVHIPVPHPGGIYDRSRGVLTDSDTHASYEDNLALADRVLAHFRAELVARGEWDSSLVLVMGDHAWRTKLLWSGQRGWTAEDQVASHGGAFDPRPVYTVKLPYEHLGTQLNRSFPTVRTRALLDSAMNGGLDTPADLQTWVQQQ